MPNMEDLGRLRQEVKAWNQWREEHPEHQPDLSGAKLLGRFLVMANLSGANLSQAVLASAQLTGGDLHEAHLEGANLFRADLRDTNLEGAHLAGADLRETRLNHATLARADLFGVDLAGADLVGVDFSQANLTRANLFAATLAGTNLTGANLSETRMGRTILGAADLSTVQELETVKHVGPSTIGIDTLYRSGGQIPEVFLRGCGVPNEVITYVKSLVGHPFEYHSCFISYSSTDTRLAERLYADLQATGVRCWYAPEDLKIGDKFRSRIDEAIQLHDKLLLILSKRSLESPWIEKEVETAFAKEAKEQRTVLFPLRVDQAIMQYDRGWAADIQRTRHIGDFRRWKNHDAYRKSFDRLLRDLKVASQ
jgi:hypothetical protein